ncbi:MAG: hypothetical protein VXV86_03925, partial [Verrucomicrobiota bacterium]|nr:hypothetical protein [Verrucomicrobiota bacterium]
VRGLTHPSPHVDVLAHDPEQLHGVIRSTATPTDSVRITVGALDALGNSARIFKSSIKQTFTSYQLLFSHERSSKNYLHDH